MQLVRPEWLWFLLAFPFLGIRAAFGRSRRARDWLALGQGGRPATDGATLWLAAAGCLCLALARPRWGRSDEPPLPPGHDVVIAMDVSRSMAATDAVPDRLGLAVEVAVSLTSALGREAGDRVAVVAFAGRGVLRCPLTRNLGAAVDTLRSLKPGQIRPGGTDLASGLVTAFEAFDDQVRGGGRTVVVFSDGEDLADHWPAAAVRLVGKGVIVHTVAVGDPEAGHLVPLRSGKESTPLRFHGSVVLSRRSDRALAAIARETGGAFIPLGLATTDLGELYQARIEPGERALRGATLTNESAERFPLFLIAALAFALAASRPGHPGLTVRRGWIAGLAAVLVGAAPHERPALAVARGRAAYAAGRHAEAIDAFRQALRSAPRNAVTSYDLAATLFQLGRFEEAQNLYRFARTRADAALRTKIDYALGNTTLARGDLKSAIRHYDDCLASRARGADLDRVRRDAAVNRRFVVEQERRSLSPPDSASGGQAEKPFGKTSGDGERSREQNGNASGPAGSPTNPDDSRSQNRQFDSGDAGGVGTTSPANGSSEARLSDALRNVRDARSRRIEETLEADEHDDRKDW